MDYAHLVLSSLLECNPAVRIAHFCCSFFSFVRNDNRYPKDVKAEDKVVPGSGVVWSKAGDSIRSALRDEEGVGMKISCSVESASHSVFAVGVFGVVTPTLAAFA